ncbi:MAG: PSP1 domain-containing protein, partial [Flavobacteriales bacterium]
MESTVGYTVSDFVEVRFKNTRKQFFKQENLRLNEGDVVAVEASPGHDVGTVSLAGDLVMLQMRKRKVDSATADLKKVFRKATETDISKWQEAVELEQQTKTRARIIARELGLSMKISDVEFQGDKSKAIFYYTSEARVDFRELIRKYAEEFKVRVEMKQIGARQEAARLGGIGPCGRELCCSTWLTDFRTVSTSAARYQQLSLNPQKLAGQCGKLKCCLNFELDSYLDALKDFPSQKTKLETQKGTAFTQKVDIFRGIMWFTFRDDPSNFIEVPIARVKEVIKMNKDGQKPQVLVEKEYSAAPVVKHDYENVVGQDDLTRFDKPKGKGGSRNNKGR